MEEWGEGGVSESFVMILVSCVYIFVSGEWRRKKGREEGREGKGDAQTT